MYGHIHLSIQQWVLAAYGDDKWEEICEEASINEFADFMIYHRYDDARTVQILGAICKVLGLDLPKCLEEYGEYFFKFWMANEKDHTLMTLGPDLYTFIQNLDALHFEIHANYPDIVPPSFRCEKIELNKLKVHYYSPRKGLFPWVKGTLTAAGRELFNSKLSFNVLTAESNTLADGQHQDHVAFEIVEEMINPSEPDDRFKIQDRTKSLCPTTGLVEANDLCSVLPYHIIFGPGLEIRQIGENVERMVRRKDLVGKKLSEVAKLVHPTVPFDYKHVLEYINTGFMVQFTPIDEIDAEKSPPLKGQMIPLSGDGGNIIFMSSPFVESLVELMKKEVYMSDIPLFDATRSVVMYYEQRFLDNQNVKKLGEMSSRLKIISRCFEREKSKAEELQYQMLPKSVALRFSVGSAVAADKFETSTILFSEVYALTEISSHVEPVEIVKMLNELYIKYDRLTTTHDVYKIETNGDAYMVVGGVPTPSDRHAHAIAAFALDMLVEAGKVKSPAAEVPLYARVGFHSGPVVAGVVGKKIAKYCLFGDSVSIASHMQVNGLPGRIQFSQAAFENIQDSEFEICLRGLKYVKGFGLMNTYLLEGKGKKGESIPLKNPGAPEEPDEKIPTEKSGVCTIL